MNGLEYPEWQQPYQEAVLETDDHRISERIQTAQTAIVARMTSMRITAETRHEAMKLENALRKLASIKEERRNANRQEHPSARPAPLESQSD